MALKTSEQSLRSSLKGQELDLMLEEIFPGQSVHSSPPDGLWRASLFPPHPLDAQTQLKRVQKETDSQKDPRAKEVCFHGGRITTLKPKSPFPRGRKTRMFKF